MDQVNQEVKASTPAPKANPSTPLGTGKKLSKGKIIGLVVLVVVIWFLGVQWFAAERYKMLVNVKAEDNIMGINPLAENLDFGDLSHNLGATRIVTLKNDSKSDRYILIWKQGEIADMVKTEKNSYVLKAGEELKIEFTIQIPPSAEPRGYQGKAIIFRWPKIF